MRAALLPALALLAPACAGPAAVADQAVPTRAPLVPARFLPLDLGSVRARGWLANELELQARGLTGHAEEVLPGLGPDSGWRGGDGESWEKGPYYVRGLVALAFERDDPALEARAREWIEWELEHQRPDGQIGPRGNDDWWPRMVMTQALRDFFEATRDPRVFPCLTRYFRYALANLPGRPLAEWARARAGDQIATVLWLYDRTGDAFLLDLADLLRSQANDWESFYRTLRGRPGDFRIEHGVNVSQAMKLPALTFQRTGDAGDRAVFGAAWENLTRADGLPSGMWSGTEALAGRSTTQGVEMCSIVEQMLSNEVALGVLGNAEIGDRLERIAFNLLPGGTTKDFRQYQYYTIPNAPVARRGRIGFRDDHGDDLAPSPHAGFHCCCYNLHMGWPKYVQHAWMATEDGGLAAVAYGPTEVSVELGGTPVTIREETDYPFADSIRFTVETGRPLAFPLRLRVPGWSVAPRFAVNGRAVAGAEPGTFLTLARTWRSGDVVTAELPARLVARSGYAGSAAIWRGPLVFSLRIGEEARPLDTVAEGFDELEVVPTTPWNYALDVDRDDPAAAIAVERAPMPANPWLPDTTPIRLTAPARRVPGWGLDADGTRAAEVPPSPVRTDAPLERVTLVPFGAQTLRITAFPLLRSAAIPEPGITASHANPGDATDAILTNPAPADSLGAGLPRFTFWDHRGTTEWIQWTFAAPTHVAATSIDWFDDTGSGRCRVPASWRLLYRRDGAWVPVSSPSGFPVARDRTSTVAFDPVTTDALRVEVRLQEGFSGGLLRWTRE